MRLTVWLIAANMPGLDKRGFDVEGVDFVQHALYQSLHRILGGAKRAQARNAEGARCAAEDEVATTVLLSEIGQAELEDVERAKEIGLELVADLIVVLVFGGADDAVASAGCDDVDVAPVCD